jgi:hypothetical protein
MTIDSGWVRVFKEEAPEAFQASYPFPGTAKVAYIDGMPLLMTCERNVHSWDDLLRFNYARHINRYFRLGCEAVVLAYDDYERVPMAKAITQANRVKKKAAYEFGEGSQLPPTMPAQYNEKLSNRVFKRRVIDMVCNRVLEHIAVSPSERYSRSFVLDYTGCPVLFQAPPGRDRFQGGRPTFLVDMPPMGEADVKYLRWAEHFDGNMIAYSIDGDFIPIALMSYEAKMLKLRKQHKGDQQQLQRSQQPCHVHSIAIYRIKYKAPGTAAAAPPKPRQDKLQSKIAMVPVGRGNKKARLGLAMPAASAAADSNSKAEGNSAASVKSSPIREFEYVDIPKLYLALRNAFSSFAPSCKRQPLHHYHYMRMLAVLVGLGGTDFSRSLPYVGPATLWGMLSSHSSVFSSLLRSYDPAEGRTDAEDACNAFASSIYMCKFATHFKSAQQSQMKYSALTLGAKRTREDSSSTSDSDEDEGGFQEVMQTLQASQLSERTKRDLPSSARVNATFRNINWLLQYWTCTPPIKRNESGTGQDNNAPVDATPSTLSAWDYSVCYPDPVCAEYGFKYRKCCTKKGKHASHGKVQGGSHAAVRWLDDDNDSGEEIQAADKDTDIIKRSEEVV